MSESAFDLVVIGAGPGGYAAAVRASELGMKVACVDRDRLGGTCLNVGCIPSKALLESSERYHELSAAGLQAHGIQVGEVRLDLAAMMARKQKIVSTMTQGIGSLFRKHKVEFLAGTGVVPEAGVVAVESSEGTQIVKAERIILALGSVPTQLPSLPFDGEYILSSTEALSLTEVPERMVVIGAGAIGLELGSVWNRLGAQVLVVEYTDSLLPGADREIATQLQRVLKRQGLRFELQTSAEHASIANGKVALTVVPAGEREGDSRVEECDCVLVAVGRRPCHQGSGIETLGVAFDGRDYVIVDGDFRTNVPGLYAIGDLIPGPMLAHKAEMEGVVAVERMAGMGSSASYRAIPNVVYTQPEVAAVGATEEEAAADGVDYCVGKFQFRANARAHCMDAIDGLVKIISEKGTDRLLGMHILGPQASHLIAEGVLAMEFSASAEDVARTVHAHPSLSEVIGGAAAAAAAQSD